MKPTIKLPTKNKERQTKPKVNSTINDVKVLLINGLFSCLSNLDKIDPSDQAKYLPSLAKAVILLQQEKEDITDQELQEMLKIVSGGIKI